MTVTVIVPTYKPDGKFFQLMNMLKRQTCKADHILIMNTEERYWKNSFMEGLDNWEVHHLSRAAFDHGKREEKAQSLQTLKFWFTLPRMQCLLMKNCWKIY